MVAARLGFEKAMAARLGFEKAMVGIRRATPRPDCMDRLRKHYSHLAEGWLLARKAAWPLSGCMATNSADYCMLVNEWVWSKSRDCSPVGCCAHGGARLGFEKAMAARPGFEKAMVGTRRATPRPDCMDRLRKHYSHLAEGWLLARKAAWPLSGCMATNSVDYCMLVNEWVWSKSRDCLFRPEVDMGSVLESELGQKWR